MENYRSLKGARIALIEDDTLLRSSIEIFLRVKGAFVEVFGCAEDAIPAVSRNGFDAVICDFLLPGENGLYALNRARQSSRTVGTILITAYGISTLTEDARQAGVDIILLKPFSTLDLEKALHQAIGKETDGNKSVPEAG